MLQAAVPVSPVPQAVRLTVPLFTHFPVVGKKRCVDLELLSKAKEEPEEDEGLYDNVLLWNFDKLTEKGAQKTEILAKLEPGNYMTIDLGLTVEVMKRTFIGFSYIVPADDDPTAQQEYYSKMFRDINQKGVSLLELESRKSLYFLNDKYEGYFDPEFIEGYHVQFAAGTQQQLDFVRYLSMLAAYVSQNRNVKMVARGYRRIMEKYYEEYIFSVLKGEHEDKFGKFGDFFPNKIFINDIAKLKDTMAVLKIPKSFPSIINMDMYFFGLIYHVLFMHHEIDGDRKDALMQELEDVIKQFRDDPKHSTAPGQMGHLRQRITKSIDSYSNYLKP